MIEINIQNKEEVVWPMIQSFLETNSCKKIIIYTEEEKVENKTDVSEIKHSFDFKGELYTLLKQLGYPTHLLGYKYIIDSILMYIENGRSVIGITKFFYPKIANKYNSTPSRVERAIRHGIDISWINGDIEVIEDIFGYTVSSESRKPTNSQYIASISEELIRREERSNEN